MTRTQELRTLITARKEGDCGRGTYGWIFPKNLLAEFDFLSVFTSVSSPLLLLLFNSKRSLRSIFVESCSIERFHSRGQRLCKFILTKESVYIRKEFNSHRTGLGHQHGHRFIVLGHQYGRHGVMCKHYHWKEIYCFCFVLLCIWGQFSKYKPPGSYIWRGDLTGGFLRYRFGRGGVYLEGIIHIAASFQNFTVLFLLPYGSGNWKGCCNKPWTPKGILRISSDGDDQRNFLGLKYVISGFFWIGNFWQVFFG